MTPIAKIISDELDKTGYLTDEWIENLVVEIKTKLVKNYKSKKLISCIGSVESVVDELFDIDKEK